MFDFIDCNKNGSITIVEFMTTMDDLGEADDYGKWIFTLFKKIQNFSSDRGRKLFLRSILSERLFTIDNLNNSFLLWIIDYKL